MAEATFMLAVRKFVSTFAKVWLIPCGFASSSESVRR